MLLIATECAAAPAFAECPDPSQTIATDRPGVTNSSLVVPTGSFQAENGITWTANPGQASLDGPNTRFRLGVAECTELRIDVPDYTDNITGHGPNGFSDVVPAIKYQFGSLPEGTNLSATVGLAFPTGTRAISGSGYNPYIQFPWTQKLGPDWTVGGMLSTLWVTGQSERATILQPSFLIARQVGPNASVFGEYIGIYETHTLPQQLLNFGASYSLTKLQQIDFHVGFGLNRESPDYFIGIGYSVRFDRLW